MKFNKSNTFKMLAVFLGASLLTACAGGGGSNDRNLPLKGFSTSASGQATAVNRYLWAASLETLDFLPISSADPLAGLIITDWYINPEAPAERFKTNVYILDSALRADALRVSVFKQGRVDGAVEWIDQAVNPATAREIENAILTRARQLRLNVIDG